MNALKPIDIERAKRPVQKEESSIFAALAGARGEFPDIPKNRVATVKMKNGGQYSYKYADLADILSATTPALSAWGLFVTQNTTPEGIVTIVFYKDGGRIDSEPWPVKPMPTRDLLDAQSYQSAAQVARRYCYCTTLGIAPEDTIEGDTSRKTGLPENLNADFSTGDGIRMPAGAKFKADDDQRTKAQAAAEAIIGQFDKVKTQVGVNGVWSRNEDFIAVLQERHSDLYDNVFEAFHRHMDDKGESE